MENPSDDKNRIDCTSVPEIGSILRQISVRSAHSFLLQHAEIEATIKDTRDLMRQNQPLGRLVIHIGGTLESRGVTANDAYALGVMHGIQLAERHAQEEALNTQFQLPTTPHALDDQNA